MKIKFMYKNNCLLVIFLRLNGIAKIKNAKLKCYVLGPKSQKFPTAENTRYTVIEDIDHVDALLLKVMYQYSQGHTPIPQAIYRMTYK